MQILQESPPFTMSQDEHPHMEKLCTPLPISFAFAPPLDYFCNSIFFPWPLWNILSAEVYAAVPPLQRENKEKKVSNLHS